MSHMIQLLCFSSMNVIMGRNVCAGQSYADQKRLMDQIFDQQHTRKDIRPVQNLTEMLQVNFTHEVRIIEAVDIPSADICVLSYLTISWFDQNIRWNSSDFHGLSAIDIPDGLIWSPALDESYSKKCTSTQKEQELKITRVTSNGRVELKIITYLTTFCVINMFLYPFDEHACIFFFYDPRYSNREIKLHLVDIEFLNKNTFLENQEWNVKKSMSYPYIFSLFDNAYHSAVCNYLLIYRRPGFVIVNLFFPAWLLSFLNICVPLIPPDSGERLSFAITLCLAMVFVNMSLVTDMPKNSLKISVLSWLLTFTDIMHTIGILWSIFIIRISKMSSETTNIPSIFRKLLRKPKQSRIKQDPDKVSIFDKQQENVNAISEELQNESKRVQNKNASERIYEQVDDFGWYEVARLLDKIYFFISVVIVILIITINIYIFRDKLYSLF